MALRARLYTGMWCQQTINLGKQCWTYICLFFLNTAPSMDVDVWSSIERKHNPVLKWVQVLRNPVNNIGNLGHLGLQVDKFACEVTTTCKTVGILQKFSLVRLWYKPLNLCIRRAGGGFWLQIWRVPGELQRVMGNQVANILLRRFTPGSIAFGEKHRLVIRKSNWAYDVACRWKATLQFTEICWMWCEFLTTDGLGDIPIYFFVRGETWTARCPGISLSMWSNV